MIYYIKAQPPPEILTNYLWKHKQSCILVIPSDNTSNTSGNPMMPNMRAMIQAMQPFILPVSEIAEVVDNL